MKKIKILLLALIGAFVFALSGCSNNDIFTKKAYSSGENEIKKVTVQVEDRDLEISASENNQIYIDYFDGEKEYLEISVSQGKELTVKLVYNKSWTDYVGAKTSAQYRKIKIKVPDNLIAALSVKTTNENIKINRLSFTEHLSLDADGGDIVCERVNAGKTINLKAKNGDISGSVTGGWDDFSITCKIKKGNCNLPELKEGGEKSLYADCNNGDINIEFVK